MTACIVDQESDGLNVRFRLVWAAAGLTHSYHAQQQGQRAKQQARGQTELQQPQIQLVHFRVPLETWEDITSVRIISDMKGESMSRGEQALKQYLWIIVVTSWIAILFHTFSPQPIIHADILGITIEGDESRDTPLWD